MNAADVIRATAALDTPLLAVDVDRAEANAVAMATRVHDAGRAFFPHVKHHKSSAVAAMQLRAGAEGLTCQKLGEAEVMAQSTAADHLMIPYEIVGANKINRLAALAPELRVTTAVDDPVAAQQIDRRCAEAGVTVDLLLEVDTGYHRCGIQVEDTAAFVDALGDLRAARLAGVMTYAGHVYDCTSRTGVESVARRAYDALGDAADVLRRSGIEPRVSVGATACHRIALEHPAITEVRFGSYLFGDRANVLLGWGDLASCALGVVATVVSIPTGHQLVLDVGSKGLSFATVAGQPGYGTVLEDPKAVIARLSDEHAMVRVSDGARYRRGDRVVVIPNSHALSVNQFDQLHPIAGGAVQAAWPIDARGRTT